NGYRRIQRKSPPSCEHLLLPLMRCSTQTLEESGIEARRKNELKFHDDRNRLRCSCRRRQRELDVYVDKRIRGVVDTAAELFRDDGHVAMLLSSRARHVPRDGRHVLRYAPIDLAGEVLNDLRSTNLPPFGCRGNASSILGSQRIGQRALRIRCRLVVVGC